MTGGSENYAVSAECEHPDEAVAFLKFMTTREQAEKQTSETGLPNALIDGITEENSDPVIADAYVTARTIRQSQSGWISVLMEACKHLYDKSAGRTGR